METVSVVVQTACDGAVARLAITFTAENDRHAPYQGTVAIALCDAHALAALAYCDGPPLALQLVALHLHRGQTVTRYTLAVRLSPQSQSCDLSWGIPLGAAATDLATLTWRWQTRGACPDPTPDPR